MNKNLFLKDNIALKLFSDEKLKSYTAKIISSVTGLTVNEENLHYCSNNINNNINYKDKFTDAIFNIDNDTEHNIVNIEVNYNNNRLVQNKNMNYLFQLVVNQTKSGKDKRYNEINL